MSHQLIKIVLIFLLSISFAGCTKSTNLTAKSGDSNTNGVKNEERAEVVDPSLFYSERFGFSFELKEGFEATRYPQEQGALMVKSGGIDGYRVEIKIIAEENLSDYKSLADFLMAKYPDYSKSFFKLSNLDGAFVDERVGDDAIKNFFIFSKNEKVIYSGYLRVPAINFHLHEQGFIDYVKSLKIYD